VFPGLEFKIDNKSFYVMPEDYILNYEGQCVFEIMQGDEWILGLNFF
jgi:hypothetical protein